MQSIQNIQVILASSAQWRSDILNKLEISHHAVPHQYQEPQYQSGSIQEFVEKLAVEKGKSILSKYSDCLVISSDQMIALDNQVFGKPISEAKAFQQLKILQGNTHQLFCSVAILFQGKIKVATEIAQLSMRNLLDSEIEFYLKHDQPFGCAGSYKIESLGASLFEKIETSDPNTIIGLPSNLLLSILREWKFSNLL
ncbi:MAG: septum formation protein [bacterium]|jgi:septum formation protein